MYSSVKAKVIEPLQKVTIRLFGNGEYERVCDAYDDEFGALGINNYGTTPGFHPKSKTSGIRKVVFLVATAAIAVIIFALIMTGSFKSDKSVPTAKIGALTSDAGESPAAVNTRELDNFLKMGQVNPQTGELNVDLNKDNEVTQILEGLKSNDINAESNAMGGQIVKLQNRLKAQLVIKKNMLEEQIKNLQNELDATKK